jgi:hypothetical protein
VPADRLAGLEGGDPEEPSAEGPRRAGVEAGAAGVRGDAGLLDDVGDGDLAPERGGDHAAHPGLDVRDVAVEEGPEGVPVPPPHAAQELHLPAPVPIRGWHAHPSPGFPWRS